MTSQTVPVTDSDETPREAPPGRGHKYFEIVFVNVGEGRGDNPPIVMGTGLFRAGMSVA